MDPRTASEYIRDNFLPEDRLAAVLLNKQTGHVLQRVATAEKIGDDRYQSWLRHMNARRYEVYVTWNRTAGISFLLTPVRVLRWRGFCCHPPAGRTP